MCRRYAVTRCTGDYRCCMDCKAVKSFDISLKQPEWATIQFVDEHSSSSFTVVIGVGISIYVTVYVALLVMRSARTSNVKKKEKLQTVKYRYRRAATGMLLIFGFLWLVAITTYCVSYVTSRWHTLKDCQNKLFSVLSWNIVLILASFDYTLYFIPTTTRVLTKSKSSSLRATTLVNVVGGILLLWWFFVGIYLEGAYNGRWLMTL